MGPPVLRPRQCCGHRVQHTQPRRGHADVAEANRAKQRIVLGGQAHPELCPHAAQAARKPRGARVVDGTTARPAQHSLLPGLRVRQAHAGRVVPIRQAARKARGVEAVPAIVYAAVRRREGERLPAPQQVHVHATAVGPGCALPFCPVRPTGALGRFRPAPAARRGTGPLLQQQRKGPHAGIRQEVRRQAVFRQRVAGRTEDHALVVGHVALDQERAVLCMGILIVRGLEEATLAPPAQRRHPLEVFRRRPGTDGQRKRRGVGGDHVLPRLSAQRQRPQAKGPVLVVHLRVEGVPARLGHAPGPVQTTPQRALRRDRPAAALAQQRPLRGAHQQLRHQIFEHRAAPGQQRSPAVHGGAAPAQPPPVARGDLPERDGHIAQYPRLGGQQVVVGLASPAGLRVHADGE